MIGVEELNEQLGGVNIYPNPASSTLTFKVSNVVDNLELNIHDVLGRHLDGPYKFNKGDKNIEMDISDYNSGIYFVIFTTPGATGRGVFFKN